MVKIGLSTILILFSSFSYSQVGNIVKVSGNTFDIKIENENIKYHDVKKGKFVERDYYNYTDVSKPGSYKLPVKTILIALPFGSKPRISIISEKQNKYSKIFPSVNPFTTRVNDSTIVEYPSTKNNSVENSSRTQIEIKGMTWYRDFYCMVVKVNLANYISEASEIIEYSNIILSVNLNISYTITPKSPLQILNPMDRELKELIYNNEIAEQFRGNPQNILNDTTGAWIDYSLNYLKMGVHQDGIYRITKSDLDNLGINTSQIDPRSFKLFESGNEQEIYVEGENDGVFNNSDYVEFTGHKNYNQDTLYRTINPSDKPYNNFLNKYSDTTYYFLTWNSSLGRRVKILSNSLNASDTLDYYCSFKHFEKNVIAQFLFDGELENQSPYWVRNKTWIYSQNDWLYSGTQRTYTFDAPDLIVGKFAKFYFKLISASSDRPENSHNLVMKINNTTLDSQIVNRYDQVLLYGTESTNDLNLTGNNLQVKNYNNGTTTNGVAVDWYDIEYPRMLKLMNDSIYFRINDDVQTGIKIIRLNNAHPLDYVIYKVKPIIKKIENYSVINGELFFTDTVSSKDEYIVIDSSKITAPSFYYKKQFVNLRSVSEQTDYIAITHPDFHNSVQNYLNFIESSYNVKTSLYETNDIYDEFGFGYPTPESIKLFIETTFQNRVDPKPSYLVLFGDADYDYKGYKLQNEGVRVGENLVPSFGNPVSDEWYTIWSDSVLPVPQMKVGRIPFNTNQELNYYLSKVQNNFSSPFNEWNKRYIFFSGGDANNPGELDILKSENQYVIDSYIRPNPIAGEFTHFYKTIDPQSDFGPYTPQQVTNTINDGAVFISYLGHSGTATWDNNISSTEQLLNIVNRNPLITDFGCSTNKFAEPDIVCFGERFLLSSTGQAIGYIGNSSLGFTSTTTTVPQLFYSSIVQDSVREIGAAHLDAKIQLLNLYGGSGSYKVFSYTNTLLGDPIIQLKIPSLPNLEISENDFLLQNQFPNDKTDSVLVKAIVNNWGISNNDSLHINYQHKVNNNLIESADLSILTPGYKDTLNIWLHTKNYPGEHTLTVNLDPDNQLTEIYESDNSSTFTFNVASLDVRDLILSEVENPIIDSLLVISPSIYANLSYNFILELADNPNFNNSIESNLEIDSPYKRLGFASLNAGQRYWLRYKININEAEFSQTKSFLNIQGDRYFLNDEVSFDSGEKQNVDYTNSNLEIVEDSVKLSVLSAGWYAGGTCVISINGENILPSTFFAGMGIAVLSSSSLNIDTVSEFQLFNEPGNVEALANMIDSIPSGKIVLMGVADDARNNLSSHLRNAIKSLGSTKIDSLLFRGSWALIGKKGAVPGDVVEEIKGPYDGSILIDSIFVTEPEEGNFISSVIGPVDEWKKMDVSYSTPSNSSITFRPLGIRSDETIDTLNSLNVISGQADLSMVDAKIYPKLKIFMNFNAASDRQSPTLSSLGVDYNTLAELGTNYQAASVDKDTVNVGDDVTLHFDVYNVGGSPADSFNVSVEVVKSDNSRQTVLNDFVVSLDTLAEKSFAVTYNTLGLSNLNQFYIKIDPDDRVKEIYKDNNIFTLPFYVKGDSSIPTVNLTFDGNQIFDGDFVSSDPVIKIEVNDPSYLPITDTTALRIRIDNKPVYYSGNEMLTYQFNATNPKMLAEYRPHLEDGDYSINLLAKNASGNINDSAGVTRTFTVLSDTRLLYVYNYPNPFAGETYFTFKLTQIPDELKINIYTVAGRLVKVIKKGPAELSTDFNRIHWDGRDEDGDRLANGVYFYKMYIKKGDKTESVTQKLAIVR